MACASSLFFECLHELKASFVALTRSGSTTSIRSAALRKLVFLDCAMNCGRGDSALCIARHQRESAFPQQRSTNGVLGVAADPADVAPMDADGDTLASVDSAKSASSAVALDLTAFALVESEYLAVSVLD